MNAGAGASAGSIPFVASGGLSSHAVSAGAQGIAAGGPSIDVEVVMLDALAPQATYVKMDIEGFEREALEGARGLLAAGQTAFAVTLYHRMSDLWQLPLFIHAVCSGPPPLPAALRRGLGGDDLLRDTGRSGPRRPPVTS